MRVEIPKNCKKVSCMSVSEKEKSGRKSTALRIHVLPGSGGRSGRNRRGCRCCAAGQGRGQAGRDRSARRDVRSEPKSEPQADERRSVARLSLPSSAVEEAKRGPVTAAVPQQRDDEPKAEPKVGNSPLGTWITEKNAGRVRIEECGANLCGYAVEKDNSNGKKVLIDMKPGGSRWNGRIHDVRSGKIYASHMSLRGANGAAGRGLRLRRPVLRRRDLEARRVIQLPNLPKTSMPGLVPGIDVSACSGESLPPT